MNKQGDRLEEFLDSSNYRQLSANQQKHAKEILTRFNQFMEQEQGIQPSEWTPAAVKEVMVGGFIAAPELTNAFGIAVAPVLKAYQTFWGNEQLPEIEKAIDEKRSAMNQCRKAHKTLAELNGKEDKPELLTDQKSPMEVMPKEAIIKFVDHVKQDVATASEFQGKELGVDDEQYLVAEFLQLMYDECHQGPNQWAFNDLQLVLGMMMPLDPNITKLEILNIVPTAQALFDYLKRTDQINEEQYRIVRESIAHMQTSQNMLASMERRQRTTQLMLSYIKSQGVDTDDLKTTEQWMDDNQSKVADFMRSILHPWAEYEREQLQQQPIIKQQTTPVAQQTFTKKKRAPQGIKFSRKKRKKQHHK